MTDKIHNPLAEMYMPLFEYGNGLNGFSVESCQPQVEIKRAYKKRPAIAYVWFSSRCGFGVPVSVQTDSAVWVHEFTENTMAAIVDETTGKCGLKWKLPRWTKMNGDCNFSKPTIAHFLTSLTEISGIYNNDEGMSWLDANEYFERYLVDATSKTPEGCTRVIKYRTHRIRHTGGTQVFNSLPKDMKQLIRERVIQLYEMGTRPGGYDSVLTTPYGISLKILEEFGIRIWGKTCQRIISKYFF